jgi:hypothetical protein
LSGYDVRHARVCVQLPRTVVKALQDVIRLHPGADYFNEFTMHELRLMSPVQLVDNFCPSMNAFVDAVQRKHADELRMHPMRSATNDDDDCAVLS